MNYNSPKKKNEIKHQSNFQNVMIIALMELIYKEMKRVTQQQPPRKYKTVTVNVNLMMIIIKMSIHFHTLKVLLLLVLLLCRKSFVCLSYIFLCSSLFCEKMKL